MTLGKIAEWIIKNRKGKSFEGYSFDKICQQLSDCAEKGTMLCVFDEDAYIAGVVCCEKREPNILYVFDILSIKEGTIKQMMKYFMNRFPGWTIQGKHRTGRLRHFKNPRKLTNRL